MMASSLMWSSAGILIKLIPWSSMAIAGVRSLIAVLPVLLYMGLARLPFRLNRHSVLVGLSLGTTLLLFVAANKLTTAANAVVLQFTAPVYIVVLSGIFLGQKFRRADYLAVALTLGGIALCFADKMGAGSLGGNLASLGSGFTYGCMFLLTGQADKATRISGILLGQVFAALVGLPFLLVAPPVLSGVAVGSVIALGIVQLGIPYVLLAVAQSHCSALVCCLISALEPLLNPLWVFLLNGEAPGPLALVGSGVVIVTVTLWNIWSDRQTRRAAANCKEETV